MAELNAMNILNTIRDNLATTYAERVPKATADNIAEVGKAITSDDITTNAFVNALINKVALSNVRSKMFRNPLEILKGTNIPMGANIEEIFINPSVSTGYSEDGAHLLKTTKPDGKVCYYGMSRQDRYPITINEDMLNRAFHSEQEFMSMYNAIVTSMYSGDQIDEFLLAKKVIGKSIDNGAMLVVDVDVTKPKEVSKSISNISKSFQFPTTSYCGYNLVNKDKITANNEKGCITFCPADNQCLMIRADMQTEIDYEVLATMFHMEVAKLEAITVLVDDIPSEKYDCYAVLCDREAVQMRDVVFKTTSNYNGSNLEWNFWLHHWEFIFLSMFGNACAFGKKKTVTEPSTK